MDALSIREYVVRFPAAQDPLYTATTLLRTVNKVRLSAQCYLYIVTLTANA